jgi:dTDP-4-amino-4,6-dideoxygalactose transaminase
MTNAIPLVDLHAQYAEIRDEVLAAIDGVLDGMRLTLGPNVVAFEQEFAAYCGSADCVGVGSGTDALLLALQALGIGAGDEVIVPAHTIIATAEAVSLVGARPIIVDVEPGSRCLDPDLVERAISPRTRAMIAVHMHGQMADLDRLADLGARHRIPLIEDAAQAHGAELRGRRAGSVGALGCFSFYCSKNLGAYGEAGAITTSDPELAAKLRLLRNHGDGGHYEHVRLGTNSRLDELQAAILRIKLRRLDAWNALRRRHAAVLAGLLEDAGLELPGEADGRRHIYHHFAVLAPDRLSLQRDLAAAGVMTGIHYPRPLHLQPPYRALGYQPGDHPVAERIATNVLSLPMYPELQDEQLARIATAARSALTATHSG